MFKKFLHGLLRPLIVDAVNCELEYLAYVDPPKLERIKINYIKHTKKMTVWQALESNPVEISLCVTYIDINGLEDFTSYQLQDVTHLKQFMEMFTPKHDVFNHVGLHVKPQGSNKSIIETLVSTSSDKQYSTTELAKVFDPLIEWIKQRPELLI